MAPAYSQDLRDRVIDAVVRGGMSWASGCGAIWGERVVGDQVGAALRAERFARGEQDGRIPASETRAASRISRSAERREIRHHA